MQTGEVITSVDTLQDIDELYVTEVRHSWMWEQRCKPLSPHLAQHLDTLEL